MIRKKKKSGGYAEPDYPSRENLSGDKEDFGDELFSGIDEEEPVYTQEEYYEGGDEYSQYADEPAYEYSEEPEDENSGGNKVKGKKQKKEKPKKEKVKKEKPPKEKKEKTEKPKGKFRKFKIVLISTLVVLMLIVGGIVAGGYYVTVSDVNLPKVYVDGVFVGGMNNAETIKALEDSGWDERTDIALRVKLPAGVSFKLDRCDAGAIYTKDAAVKMAYRYGHSDNIFENLLRYIENLIKPVDVSEGYLRLNEDYIKQKAEAGIEKFLKKTEDRGYTVDKEAGKLSMVKGAGEMMIDSDALASQIAQALQNDEKVLVYDHIDNKLEPPDFEEIYDELSSEPQNAAYDEKFNVTDEVVGCEFSVEEAKSMWEAAQPAEKIEIPLNVQFPEVTGDYLRSLIYRDVLGSQTTYYDGSTEERINNIKLATEKINGLIMMPGDVFSYNETVGQRTEEAGFKSAGAYADGEVVQEVGGGICQVSSTLYCAAMYSQLETVSRTNHYFKVAYLDFGMDATVSWPKPDFKFKNNRDYPVKINAYCNDEDSSLTIEILGTNLDGSYVEITHNQLVVKGLPEYPEVVTGYGVTATRHVYDKDGNEIQTIQEPYGIYNHHKDYIDEQINNIYGGSEE